MFKIKLLRRNRAVMFLFYFTGSVMFFSNVLKPISFIVTALSLISIILITNNISLANKRLIREAKKNRRINLSRNKCINKIDSLFSIFESNGVSTDPEENYITKDILRKYHHECNTSASFNELCREVENKVKVVSEAQNIGGDTMIKTCLRLLNLPEDVRDLEVIASAYNNIQQKLTDKLSDRNAGVKERIYQEAYTELQKQLS